MSLNFEFKNLSSMIKSKLSACLFLITGFIANAQVGINNPTPDPSSLLDLTAYDRGLLAPRMTSIQRVAIPSPANGLLVFDTDLKALCKYDTASAGKWFMVDPWVAEANTGSNVLLGTSGNVGIGVSSPTSKLEVAGDASVYNNLYVNGSSFFNGSVSASSFIGDGAIPPGAIIMWNGATIPQGWAICDGTNGTPDLRGRFIIGAGQNGSPASGDINPNYLRGKTGGYNLVGLASSEIPKHQHTVSNVISDNGMINISAGDHNHTYTMHDDDDNNDDDSSFPETGKAIATTQTGVTNTGGAHSHTITGTTGDGTSYGLQGTPHENRPPYFVLIYLMKL